MKKSNKVFIFELLKVVRHGDLGQAIPRTHNNKAYSSSGQPCNSAYLVRFFYCAVVWIVQQGAYQNPIQKQLVEHANVLISAGSKAKTFNQRQANNKTRTCHWDMSYGLTQMDNGENERLVNRRMVSKLSLLKSKAPLLGYKEGYA